MPEDKKSLVVSEEGAPTEEGETLSQELGGFQALVLFGALALFGLIVFALPTPFNPAVGTTARSQNLVETLAELDAEVVDEANLLATLDDVDAVTPEDGLGVALLTEEDATPTEVPPTEVPPTEIPPTEVPPTEVPPTEVPPTEVPQTEVPPTEVPPTEVPPTDEAVAEDVVTAAIAKGDVANGMTVFNSTHTTSSGGWMCSSCHSVDESEVRLVGPALYNIYERGVERAEDSGAATVADYVYNSIVAPASYHVPAEPAYPENLMPQNYAEVLTEQELNDLVAYLLTLGNPDA